MFNIFSFIPAFVKGALSLNDVAPTKEPLDPEKDAQLTITDILSNNGNDKIVSDILNTIPSVANSRGRRRTRSASLSSNKKQQITNESSRFEKEQQARIKFMNSVTETPVRKESTFNVGDEFDGKWYIKIVLTPGTDGEAYIVTSIHDKKGPESVLKVAYSIDKDNDTSYIEQIEKEVKIYQHLDNSPALTPEERSRFPALITKQPSTFQVYTPYKIPGSRRMKVEVTFVYFVISKITSACMETFIETIPRDDMYTYLKLIRGHFEVIHILHKAGVVHHDAHELNIFMGDVIPGDEDSIFRLKLIDFGRAKIVTEDGSNYTEDEKDMMLWLFLCQFNVQQFTHRSLKQLESVAKITYLPQEMYYFDYMYIAYVINGATWLPEFSRWKRSGLLDPSKVWNKLSTELWVLIDDNLFGKIKTTSHSLKVGNKHIAVKYKRSDFIVDVDRDIIGPMLTVFTDKINKIKQTMGN